MFPPQVTAAVESLKDKVIALASSELKKKRWEKKSDRKPIETWTLLASTLTGANQEPVSKAFAQVLPIAHAVWVFIFIPITINNNNNNNNKAAFYLRPFSPPKTLFFFSWKFHGIQASDIHRLSFPRSSSSPPWSLAHCPAVNVLAGSQTANLLTLPPPHCCLAQRCSAVGLRSVLHIWCELLPTVTVCQWHSRGQRVVGII